MFMSIPRVRVTAHGVGSKIEVPRDLRNSKSENMKSSGEKLPQHKNKCKFQIGQLLFEN